MMDLETKTNLDDLKAAINNKYLEAEQLMLTTENADQLKSLNQEISEIFNELIAKLELIPEYLRLAIEDYPSIDIVDWKLEKTEFDNRLAKWFEKLKPRPPEPSDDAIGRQASFSGHCLEQEPSSSSADEEWANAFTASDLARFDVNIARQASCSGDSWDKEPEPLSSSANNEWADAQAEFTVNIFPEVALTNSNEQQLDSRYEQNFVAICVLGQGKFGVVMESRNKKDQSYYAVKQIEIPNKPEERERAMREVRALERLKNENIVGYIDHWTETSKQPPQGWQEKVEEFMQDISSIQSSGSNSTASSTNVEKIKNQLGRNYASDSSGLTDLCTPQGEELTLDISSSQSSGLNSTASSIDIEKLINQLEHGFDLSFSENIEHTYLYIQTELCQKESLEEWLENNHSRDSKKCLVMFSQVASAIEYLHDNNLIHRDLKSANIFFSLHGDMKVGDFGLVTKSDSEMSDDVSKNSELNTVEGTHTKGVGTRLYMAPEQMSRNYGKEVDIFALGLILFELYMPFSVKTETERIREMKKARNSDFYSKFQYHHRQVDVVKLAKQMLSSQPSDRPTAQSINTSIGILIEIARLSEVHKAQEKLEECKKLFKMVVELREGLLKDLKVILGGGGVLKELIVRRKEGKGVLKELKVILENDKVVLKELTVNLEEDKVVLKELTANLEDDKGVLKDCIVILKEDKGVLKELKVVLKELTGNLEDDKGVLKDCIVILILEEHKRGLKQFKVNLKEDNGVLKELEVILEDDKGVLKELNVNLEVEEQVMLEAIKVMWEKRKRILEERKGILIAELDDSVEWEKILTARVNVLQELIGRTGTDRFFGLYKVTLKKITDELHLFLWDQ